MAIGLTLAKTDLDSKIGGMALNILNLLDQFNALKIKLDTLTDTDLTNMGYTTDEVTSLRSLASDSGAMLAQFTGASLQSGLSAPYNAAYDYRTTLRKFAGIGF